MLKSLRTKNFRKLENNFFEFERGMVVIRGSNEAGKSTLTEAIAYALFGVKSCRGSLADVVTWGQPETTLSVELVMANDGVDYTIKRSKAGAEINYEGGKVTGQTECSNFVEGLFGVNNGNVGKLVTSAQGDIRGALAQGPKATMELIENLANFELIDNVIELVQSNLLTGPTASAEAVLQAADLRLQLAQAEVIEPDTDSWEEKACALDDDSKVYAAKGDELKPKLDVALSNLNQAQQEAATAEKLQSKITMYTNAIEARKDSIEALTATFNSCPDNDTLTKAEKGYADALNAEALLKEHTAMVRMMSSYPEEFWDESEESLDIEIANQQKLQTKCREGVLDLQAEKRLLESKKVTGSVCGFCNQDVSKFPEIAAKNADLDRQIAEAEATVEVFKVDGKEAEETLGVLKRIKASNHDYKALASTNVALVQLQVPVSLSWVGQVPKALNLEDVKALSTRLQGIKDSIRSANAAEAKLETEKELVAGHELSINEALTTLKGLTLSESVDEFNETHEEVLNEFNTFQGKSGDAKVEAASIRAAIAFEHDAYGRFLKVVEEASLDVEVAKKTVADLTFNNALIKRLRAARPLIADKLWNVVLAAVSSYFSAMRGVVSVVTKAADGFKVDGHSVEGLSGSTLDILGLAIRLALTRTFLPSAPFLILDEPSAACNDARTQQMTGFLLAFGFTQTLIVTHKDVDEGAADQLITL